MLILGPVVFGGFEIPERIAFGGRHRLAVHRLPGGARVVDATGADDDDIAWSGTLAGPEAAPRLRVLDGMRRGGLAWPLLWEGWRFLVVVSRLRVEAEGPFWAPYRIRCTVLPDEEPADPLLPAGLLDPAAAAALDAAGTGDGGLASALAAAGTMARLAQARVAAG